MIAVILNPHSGGGKTLRLLPKVSAALQALEEPHYIHVTTAPNDATDAARRLAPNSRLLIAIGGDGTFNEVANGLLDTGLDVPLGLVPSGHGSDLVRSTETPKKFELALQHCLNGTRRRIDAGRLTFADGSVRRFLNMAGLGFDACVAERALSIHMPGSTLPYLWSVASTLKGYRNIHVAIETDGETRTTRAASVLVANGRFLAGGMHMAPMADLQDGLLDLAILGDLTKVEMVREVPNVYRGKHTGHPKFLHVRARSIRVESIEPARVQADGELVGAAPVTFTVEPGALLLAG